MVARRRRSGSSFSFASRAEEVGVNRQSTFREDAKTSVRAMERLFTTRFNLSSVDEMGRESPLGLPSTHWQSMGHLGQVYARALTKCHQKQIPRDETENGTAKRHVYEQKEGLSHGRNQGFEDVDTRDGRGNQAYGG